MPKLWQSGVILAAASFLAGLVNYAFQGVIGRQLPLDEYGLVNGTLGFVGMFGLPLAAIRQALIHHIAHFRASGDDARLRGLLLGSQRLLLRLTLLGCALALLLIQPLGSFFHLPRNSLVTVALAVVFANLWAEFGNAVCTGMAWFRSLAVIGLGGALIRLATGFAGTRIWIAAEPAVFAGALSLLAFAPLLIWRRQIAPPDCQPIRPSGRELAAYTLACAAFVLGQYAFLQGDLLVAQRHIAGDDLGRYTGAGQLGRALVYLASPLLMVLFQSRSAHRHRGALRDQVGLLLLYAAALAVGALGITCLRGPLAGLIFGRADTGAEQLVGRFTATMVAVGLLQAIGTWALASRWFKLTFLFGTLGAIYWLTLLFAGHDTASLLRTMLWLSGASAVLLSAAWLWSSRKPGLATQAPETH
ncbi:MAG TPA: hypothetical protein PLU30_07970 [Verrucomicrobiae bacterium]|nr:hypothetical protein [Verrucomicrobiae bacterium]